MLQVPSNTPTDKAAQRRAELFINRELSWLEFNARVIAEAADEAVPLFERLKFLAIFASNLDEFFMVRVAGLQAQLSGDSGEVPADGMTPLQQLEAISVRAHDLVQRQYAIWNQQVRPALRAEGIALLRPDELAPDDLIALDRSFEKDIFPVLTPIAIDPMHPFPHIRNKSINVGLLFEKAARSNEPSFGIVQVPRTLSRLIPVPMAGTRRAYVALGDLIIRHMRLIFPQMSVIGHLVFRLTRNFDIEVDDDEAEDLLTTIQAELRRRERGHAVRLEVAGVVPEESVAWLAGEFDLSIERDVYRVDGPLFLGDMLDLAANVEDRRLRDEPFSPQYVPPLRDSDDMFETIRQDDVLLHHPYESFEAVVDFLTLAAEDPNVLAIKQTLYRTGGESPMVRALQRAAELGKQVTALVELKARFDEESNIRWARALERSGVNVMYGLLGFKTHAKVLLVVRKEGSGLRRYVHLATGNYNQQTARLYEDISLFTAREDIGEDATALFNLLTGYSAPPRWNRLIISPLGMHEGVLGLIHRETEHARAGRPAKIIAKMNALVDEEVISALYEASQAGVDIQLLIRGICCLRPGVPKISENIRVKAVIDRFLEHARIFYFENGGTSEVFCTSADWMPRNFRRRVEAMFPILDERLKARVTNEILGTMSADNVKSWQLKPDGSYARVPKNPSAEVRSQSIFVELARERNREPDALSALVSRPFTPVRDAHTALDKLRRRKKRKREGKN
ncbi:MAG: polyphosphate kinase 1 [Polyangiaceae bacterium]|nr:polyphosphate kinase 1 [Polyangiaceae bacterium]